MLKFPIKVICDRPFVSPSVFRVVFPGLQEISTEGDSEAEARAAAEEALKTAIESYLEEHRRVPDQPDPMIDEEVIELPWSYSLRVLLLNLLVDHHMDPVDLMERLVIPRQEVESLLCPTDFLNLDLMARAFEVVGRRLDLKLTVIS
jgi:predicted RNase H-like HicB family nuclease